MAKHLSCISGIGLRQDASVGQTYVGYIHCPILLLLVIRQAYLLATFNFDRQYDETLWYSLFAVPEFLAASLFSTPGLVPVPEELPGEDKKQSDWVRLWGAYNNTSV